MSIRRNTIYNLLGSFIPLLVALVTIPLYLGVIGEARYGILAIVWLLLGYFGLFDLGLGRATAQRIASLKLGNPYKAAETFWTALFLNLGLGVVGGLLMWPIATYFFGNILNLEEILRPEIEGAVPWLILAVPIATLIGVLSGTLQGTERFLELNLISVSGTVLFQLLPLIAATIWGADLRSLLPAALFARLCTLLVLFTRCRLHVFQRHPFSFSMAEAGQLLRFGGWVTVTAFVGPMMVTLDRFIIGALTGAKEVAYYTVPFQLAERSTILANSLSSALFPRFARMAIDEELSLAHEALRILVIVTTPIVGLCVLLMQPFLGWWITPAFAAKASLVGQIVLLGFWINAAARIPFAQLQARGRPDLVAKCHLAEILPYFASLYFGLSFFGLPGAALAFSVRVIADFLLLAIFSGLLQRALPQLIIPMILLIAAFLIGAGTTPTSRDWFVLVGLHLSLTLTWAWHKAPGPVRTVVITIFVSVTRHLAKSNP